MASFGDDYIVQIGRMRTRQEEDLSVSADTRLSACSFEDEAGREDDD